MNADLKWLAENVSEWSRNGDLLFLSHMDGFMFCHPASINARANPDNCYSQTQWQAARDELENPFSSPDEDEAWQAIDAKSLEERYPQYYKSVRHLEFVDVYRVHTLFAIEDCSGCLQHASKKLLLSGSRTGGKTKRQDIEEARDTLTRWLEIEKGR